MKPDISVIISTFGEEKWQKLAQERALPSARAQTVECEIIMAHDGHSLAAARNEGARGAMGRHLVFLDADDELDERYVEAMQNTVDVMSGNFLVQPATLGIHPDGREDDEAVLIPQRELIDSNYMVIGTMIEAATFRAVGGFHEWPLYEDWDLWLRVHCALPTTVVRQPEAIYRVHVNENGRNMPERAKQVDIYNQIRRKHQSAWARRPR